MVPCGDECCVCFVGKMILRFGDFACEIHVCVCIYGSLKIPLRAACAPCDAGKRLFGVAYNGGCSAQRLFNGLGKLGERALVFGQCADVEQILFAECVFRLPVEFGGELGVVANRGMGIERQVVANQVDIMGE